ncbi:hypothetical protein BH93_02320 [Rhodococcoides fascians A25f]|uniref:hypothetical protein n=1 Tax=Rhodococcoides fascians TaxID=1828 RepID=UPI000569641C|nr:hypothetical protein [Rhodococcus fascians]QII04350.1 hypothetical protein BH93_02320 [Rhodococcus fascians A25f]
MTNPFESHLSKRNLATLDAMCAEHGQGNRAMAAATMHQMQIQEQEGARLCAIANLQFPAADASRPAWFVGETPVFDHMLLDTHEVCRTWTRSFDVPDQGWSVAIVCDDVYNEEQEEWETSGPRIAVSVEEYTELDPESAAALAIAIVDAVEALNGTAGE